MKKYYAMEQAGDTANITIYGDIVSWPWYEGDVSSYTLAKALERVEAGHINLYINSYGGEVAEGLAIYNALKRHPAQVTTYCDGFACSAASVVFMAGDERIMGSASLLMVHNAWTSAEGNADQLRKQADDLDAISTAAANAYRSAVAIGEEELAVLLKNETWITPADAVRMGFATAIAAEEPSKAPGLSARKTVMEAVQRPMGQQPELKVDTAALAKALMEGLQTWSAEPPAQKESKPLNLLSALLRKTLSEAQ